MSIDAGRAVLIVTRGISTAPTFHAKAAVVGIFLIDVRHFRPFGKALSPIRKSNSGAPLAFESL
jgi:hypothetical protein